MAQVIIRSCHLLAVWCLIVSSYHFCIHMNGEWREEVRKFCSHVNDLGKERCVNGRCEWKGLN